MRIEISVDLNDFVELKEVATFLDQYLQKHEDTKMLFGKYQLMISQTPLTTKVKNVLRRGGFRTVGCLVRGINQGYLKKTPNLGKAGFNEVADYLTSVHAL